MTIAVLVTFLIRAEGTLSLGCKAENFLFGAWFGTTISGPVVVTVVSASGATGGTTSSSPVPVGFAAGLNDLHARDGARGVLPVADGAREGEIAVSKHIRAGKVVDRRSGGAGFRGVGGGGGGGFFVGLYALLVLRGSARRQLLFAYGIIFPLVALLVLPLVIAPTMGWAAAIVGTVLIIEDHRRTLEDTFVLVGEVGGFIVDLLLGKATPGEEGGDVVGGRVGVGGRGGGDEGQGYEGNVAEEHGYSTKLCVV